MNNYLQISKVTPRSSDGPKNFIAFNPFSAANWN